MRLIIYRISQKIVILSTFLFAFGCNNNEFKESEILSIPLELTIDRFDKKFHLAKAHDIPELKNNYPFLFPKKFSDSVWIKRQKDTLQLLLLEKIEEKFSSMTPIEENLEHLFKHLKYYFPKTKIPKVIGVINNVDY